MAHLIRPRQDLELLEVRPLLQDICTVLKTEGFITGFTLVKAPGGYRLDMMVPPSITKSNSSNEITDRIKELEQKINGGQTAHQATVFLVNHSYVPRESDALVHLHGSTKSLLSKQLRRAVVDVVEAVRFGFGLEDSVIGAVQLAVTKGLFKNGEVSIHAILKSSKQLDHEKKSDLQMVVSSKNKSREVVHVQIKSSLGYQDDHIQKYPYRSSLAVNNGSDIEETAWAMHDIAIAEVSGVSAHFEIISKPDQRFKRQ